MIAQVHAFLTQLSERVRQGLVPAEQFVICKALTRNPQEYPDAKGQPHVLVALRMNEKYHTHYKHGDTVEYVMCLVSYAILPPSESDVSSPSIWCRMVLTIRPCSGLITCAS